MSFSWRRAIRHAALATGAIATAAALALASLDVSDPRKFAEFLAPCMAFVAGMAMFVSWLAQTGRRAAAWAVGVGLPAMFAAGAIGVVLTTGMPDAPSLTAVERAPMVRANGRWRSNALHFSVADPGAAYQLPAAPPFELELPDRDHIAAFELRRADDDSKLFVMVVKHPFDARRDLESFVDGFLNHLPPDIATTGPLTKSPGSHVTGDSRHADADVEVRNEHQTIHVVAHAFHTPTGMPLMIAVTADSGQAAALPPELVRALADFQHD